MAAAVGCVIFVVIVLAYFLPCLVAASRHKAHAGGVLLVNLFFGWTFIGWIIALAMAVSGLTEDEVKAVRNVHLSENVRELERAHDRGLISADEYAKRYLKLTK